MHLLIARSVLGLVVAQFDGLVAGYNLASPADRQLQALDLYFLNALGDTLDLHVANDKVCGPCCVFLPQSRGYSIPIHVILRSADIITYSYTHPIHNARRLQNARPDWLSMSHTEFYTKLATTGHCSALIRATADLSDVFLAHSRYTGAHSRDKEIWNFNSYVYDVRVVDLEGIGSKERM